MRGSRWFAIRDRSMPSPPSADTWAASYGMAVTLASSVRSNRYVDVRVSVAARSSGLADGGRVVE
jgi:hypothetical protein